MMYRKKAFGWSEFLCSRCYADEEAGWERVEQVSAQEWADENRRDASCEVCRETLAYPEEDDRDERRLGSQASGPTLPPEAFRRIY